MANEEKRRKRILKIENSIFQCGDNGCDKEKIIALMSYEYGINRRTTMDYIKTLLIIGKIKQEGNLLYGKNPEI